jgi:nitrate reductase gamma subunit
MSADALLAWARGPAFEVALTIFIAGMLLRLFEILSLGHRPDLSAARGSGVMGGLRTIATRMLPRMSVFRREPLRIINAYVMHIGLFIVIFLYAPHIALVHASLGLSWDNLPSGVVDAAAAITILSMVVALVFRLNSRTLRFLSTPEDYWVWLVTLLPVLTGYLAYNHLFLPYTSMLALHILSVELLMISAPFSKLTHAFTFVLSRWYQGYQAGHRGIES